MTGDDVFEFHPNDPRFFASSATETKPMTRTTPLEQRQSLAGYASKPEPPSDAAWAYEVERFIHDRAPITETELEACYRLSASDVHTIRITGMPPIAFLEEKQRLAKERDDAPPAA